MNGQDQQKRAAAEAAVALVEDGMVLGLGSGSTMVFAVDALARRVREEGLHVRGVPTSLRTEKQASGLGLALLELDDCAELDLAIDERRLARVAAAAEMLMPRYAGPNDDIRIDVILLAPGTRPRHIENAWIG